MNLPGELEGFIRQQRRLTRAPYVTPEVRVHIIALEMLETSAKLMKHYEHIKTSLLQGGLSSPLNWYRSNLQGVNDGIKASTSYGVFILFPMPSRE